MHFKDDQFSVDLEQHPGCNYSVRVHVQNSVTKKLYNEALKQVNKGVSIPGFRKGKAPVDTIEKKYPAIIEKEWKELVINEAVRMSFQLSETYPLNKNSIKKVKIDSCSLEEGADVSFTFEGYPQVPTIDFSLLEVPEGSKEPVKEEAIQDIVDDILRMNAEWEEVSDRSIREGDFVDMTIESIDTEPPKPIVTDRRFEMADKKIAPWLKKAVLGKKAGDVFETTSELDEKADPSVKAKFKPTHVRVTLHAIKKILLPTLTDEIAKKAGAASIEDMMQKIRSNLQSQAEEQYKQEQLRRLDQQLLDRYPFEIPSSLLERERDIRLNASLQELKQQHLSDDEIQAQEKHLEEKATKNAENAIRLFFLGKQIIEQGKISVSNEEVSKELINHLTEQSMRGQKPDEKESRELISRISSNLIQRKAKEYALAQVEAAAKR